jgi:CHAD domain-containing protein
MPFDAPARSYVLPDGVDASGLVTFLGDHLDVVSDRPATVVATVVDTADRRLRDAGLELQLEAAGTGGARLVLHEQPGRPSLTAEVARARRHLVDDLPPGALRDLLAPVVEMRALLPLARLRVETLPLRVRNRDEKTVVRLAVATPWALRSPGPPGRTRPATNPTRATPASPARTAKRTGSDAAVPLTGRVEVAGVLGYPRPLARVETLLGDELGLRDATLGPADEAIAALGGDPVGIRSKVQVELRPGWRSDRAARAVLIELAGMVDANLPGTLDDLDTEFVHDLRVAVRRSRSVLRELRRAFPARPLADQREALRWIQAVTGPTRDLDVQLLDWDGLAATVADRRRAALAPVRDLLARHRAAAFRRLRRDLRSDAFADAWVAYQDFLAGDLGPDDARPDAARPIAHVAGRRIRRVYARMLDMGAAIDEASPAGALHDLRKRGKELRYLLELFGSLWPADVVRPMVRRLKGLQDVLGRHQDREIQADHLRGLAGELAGATGGPQALLSLGALVDGLDAQQREARAAFAERFTAFAAPDQRRLVADTFRRPR